MCAGETAVFDVTATGDLLTYAWQYDDNGNWVNVGTGRPLYIPNTTNAMDGRVFRVNVTGGTCPSSQASYTSDEATLKVNPLPDTPPVTISP